VQWWKITSSVVAVVSCALTLTGCAGPDPAAPTSAAVAFVQAVSSSDGAQACALLSEDAMNALVENQGSDCAQAVLQEQLPHPAPVVRHQIFGRQALVVTRTDTMFLSQFPSGWKVIAAGCQPDGDKPYDCSISGG
jgi:hypothetical protein